MLNDTRPGTGANEPGPITRPDTTPLPEGDWDTLHDSDRRLTRDQAAGINRRLDRLEALMARILRAVDGGESR